MRFKPEKGSGLSGFCPLDYLCAFLPYLSFPFCHLFFQLAFLIVSSHHPPAPPSLLNVKTHIVSMNGLDSQALEEGNRQMATRKLKHWEWNIPTLLTIKLKYCKNVNATVNQIKRELHL